MNTNDQSSSRRSAGSAGRDSTTVVVDKQRLTDSLALLGDVTEDEEFFHLFQMLAMPPAYATVTVDAARAVYEVLGVPFDEAQLEACLAGDDELTYDRLRDVAQQLRVLAAGGEDADATSDSREIELVHLPLLSFLRHKLLCQTPPPRTEYRWAGFNFELKRRHVLISSMAVVTFICCGLMVATVALLWIDHTSSVEHDNMRRMGDTALRLLEKFEQVMMSVNGDNLKDTAGLVTSFGSSMHVETAETSRQTTQRTANAAATGAATVGAMEAAASQRSSAKVAAFLSSLPGIRRSSALSAANLVGLHATMRLPNSSTLVPGSAAACFGTSCSVAWPCLQFRGVSSFVTLQGTVNATSARSSRDQAIVCVVVGLAQFSSRVASLATSALAGLMGPQPAWSAFLRTASRPSSQTPVIQPPFDADACYSAGQCTDVDAFVLAALRTRQQASTFLADRTNHEITLAASATDFNLVILSQVSLQDLLARVRARQISIIENLNYIRAVLQGSTIEVVVMAKTASEDIVQASRPALGGCLGVCQRPSAGFANARRGFELRDSGWSITPDYRPEPVVGGYAYDADSGLDTVIVVERDVPEVRRLALESAKQLMRIINDEARKTLEFIMVHPLGELLTKTYFANDRCPLQVSCVTYDDYGVVYRSDCVHCTRHVSRPPLRLEFVTPPTLLGDCASRGINCSAASVAQSHDSFVWTAMQRRNSESEVFDKVRDYRGQQVSAFAGYLTNFSTTLVVKEDLDDFMVEIVQTVLYSTLACFGIICVVTLIFVLFARSILFRIEAEWLQYKQLIADERKAFSDSVKEIMPSYIAERITQSQRLAGETANVCIGFFDLKGTASRHEKFDAPTLARFLTYVFHMLDVVGTHYQVHRVRFVGDTSFFVSGLNETSGENSGANHYAMRMARFATTAVQLMGPRYAHYPNRCDTWSDVFGRELFTTPDLVGDPLHIGCVNMPSMTIGLHQGAVTVSLLRFQHGVPIFDVLGPNVAVAHRLCQTARDGTIYVSDAVRETIDRHAQEGMFSFGKSRKVVLRGRGTVTTCALKVASVQMPSVLFSDLGVRFAKSRKYFDDSDQKLVRDEKKSGSETSSRSDLVSTRGSDA